MGYENPKNYVLTSTFHTAFAVDGNFNAGDGLLIFDCDKMTVGTQSVERMAVKSYTYDDCFAPIGKTVIQSSYIQLSEDYEFWKNLYSDKEKYNAEKQRIASDVLERIEKKFPEYKGKITLLDVWTPMTYTRYCGAYKGSYMSFIAKPGNKNVQINQLIKGLDNVFLATQWAGSPGGLPTAITEGKYAVQRILRREKKDVRI